MAKRRFAAIDLGTNTILLLVADIEKNATFRVVTDREEITRLGEGVDRTGLISSDGAERSLKALREHLRACRDLGVDDIVAMGTSALRDARNAESFIARLKRELGLELRVLSGEEEAVYSYLAVQKGLQLEREETLVVDVGGGSTELIWGKEGKLHRWASLDLGSVRLTERFLPSDPVREEECARLTQAVDQELKGLLDEWGRPSSFHALRQAQGGEPSRTTMVGIAGTFTTLAAVRIGLRKYSHSEVHGSRLDRGEVARQIRLYKAKSIAGRREIPGLEPKRADVILAGALLIERIMTFFDIDDVIVSDQGIRYGLLYEKLAAAGT